MSISMNITESVSLLGTVYQRTLSVVGDNAAVSEPEGGIAAAKTGNLTTRTDDDTGTLTMDTGHGFTTGITIDLFWDGGSRRGITVGIVAGDSVPIDGGTGDVLPADESEITAMAPVSEVMTVTGDNAVGILVHANLLPTDGDAYVIFTTSGDVLIESYKLSGDLTSWSWDGADVGTNPLAGQTVGKVKYSHGAASAKVMGGAILYD